MLSAWPWVAIVLAAAACGLRDSGKEDTEVGGFDWVAFVPFVLALVLMLTPWPWSDGPLFARGMVTGAFVGGLAAWLVPGPVATPGRLAAVLGLAAAAAAPAHFLEPSLLPGAAQMQLGVVAGAGLAAAFAQRRSTQIGGAGAVALMVVGVVASDALGRFRLEKLQEADAAANASMALPSVGLVLCIALACGALLGGVAGRWTGAKGGWAVSLVGAWSLGALALARYLGLGSLLGVFTVAIAVGLVAVWVVASAQEDAPWPPLLAVVLTLGLAGAGFSIGRGLGLSVAAVACAAALIALPRTAPILGPLVALVLLRVAREQSESLRAIDVLHHQTAMGLVLGAALVLVSREAGWSLPLPVRRFSSSLGWMVVVGSAIAVCGYVLGPRATLAIVLGAGVGLCLTHARAAGAAQRGAGLGVAAMAFAVAGNPWVAKVFEESSRDQRLGGMAASLLGVGLGFLGIVLGGRSDVVEGER